MRQSAVLHEVVINGPHLNVLRTNLFGYLVIIKNSSFYYSFYEIMKKHFGVLVQEMRSKKYVGILQQVQ